MNHASDERSPHLSCDEHLHTSENPAPHEMLPPQETIHACDEFAVREEFTPSSSPAPVKRGESEHKNRILLGFLASAAVTCTVASAVILPFFMAPTVSVHGEDISYGSYSCFIDNRNGGTLTAVLDGEWTDPITIPLEEEFLYIDGLMPEADYRLRILNEKGESLHTRTFSTEPLVILSEEVDGRISFTMHKDVLDEMLNDGGDIGLSLYASNGNEFSSNLMWDPMAESILYTDGLYQDEYALTLTKFMPDGYPLTYEKYLTLGTLTAPTYEMTTSSILDGGSPTEIILTRLAGDLLPYDTFSVIIEATDDSGFYRSFSGNEITITDTTITIPLTETIPGGTYRVGLWGACTLDDISLDNEIWHDILPIA